jgi:nucleoid DNA-binding protein
MPTFGRTVRLNRESYPPNLRGLGKYIADKHDLSDAVSFQICADVFAFVRDASLNGASVVIKRFGTFSRRLVKERFNVSFGDSVRPQWVLKFKRSRNYGSKELEL